MGSGEGWGLGRLGSGEVGSGERCDGRRDRTGTGWVSGRYVYEWRRSCLC